MSKNKPKVGARTRLIAAYGEQSDRVRLQLLAEASGTSQSLWLLDKIRSAYQEMFGDAEPMEVLNVGS